MQPPLPGPLARGVVYIPYQVENLRILPLGGAAAGKVSPRVGHLHITIDDLPWFWADYGQSNTIILGGMPRGQHKVLIEVVDPEGKVFTGQTVTFYAPGSFQVKLDKIAAAFACGLLLLSVLALRPERMIARSGPSRPRCRKRRSMSFAGASQTPAGPTRKPTRRRACRSRACRSWFATGARTTTGARRKRS